jgi:hypothetical protein
LAHKPLIAIGAVCLIGVLTGAGLLLHLDRDIIIAVSAVLAVGYFTLGFYNGRTALYMMGVVAFASALNYVFRPPNNAITVVVCVALIGAGWIVSRQLARS